MEGQSSRNEEYVVFTELTPESFPDWTSIPELLAAIEEEIGKEGREQMEKMLEGRELPEVVNVPDLLTEIQEELGTPYFNSYLEGHNKKWIPEITYTSDYKRLDYFLRISFH